MKKVIGLTYDCKEDWKMTEGLPRDFNAEFDPPQTIAQIIEAIEACGYQTKKIGNVYQLLKMIDTLDVDIVFNIAEGYYGRNRESQVPILLEAKNIPYIGSDGLTLGLTLDKIIAKKIFQAEGVPTPRYFEASSVDNLERMNMLGYPLFVKTRHEGSSKGLSEKSRVHSKEELKRQVALINDVYQQSALVEEFIRGSEFTVAVIGNKQPEALPVVQIQINGKLDLKDDFYTFAHISSDKVQYICPAPIDAGLEKKLKDLALKVYQSVGCRDLGRIDFRVDEKGNPYVLEINPLPCLGRDDVFYFIPKALGFSYEEMIGRIIDQGLERNGLNNGKLEEAIR